MHIVKYIFVILLAYAGKYIYQFAYIYRKITVRAKFFPNSVSLGPEKLLGFKI